jgi:hypothetical protein
MWMLIFVNLPLTLQVYLCVYVRTHSLACTFRAHCVQRQFSDSSQWSHSKVALIDVHTGCTNCTLTVNHLRYTRIRTEVLAGTHRIAIVKCKPTRSDLNQ